MCNCPRCEGDDDDDCTHSEGCGFVLYPVDFDPDTSDYAFLEVKFCAEHKPVGAIKAPASSW